MAAVLRTCSSCGIAKTVNQFYRINAVSQATRLTMRCFACHHPGGVLPPPPPPVPPPVPPVPPAVPPPVPPPVPPVGPAPPPVPPPGGDGPGPFTPPGSPDGAGPRADPVPGGGPGAADRPVVPNLMLRIIQDDQGQPNGGGGAGNGGDQQRADYQRALMNTLNVIAGFLSVVAVGVLIHVTL